MPSYRLPCVHLRACTPTQTPSAICLHAYSGSLDITRSLLKLKVGTRLFFGLSLAVISRTPKLREVIAELPEDRLLLESDSSKVSEALELEPATVRLISEIRSWSEAETRDIFTRNFDLLVQMGYHGLIKTQNRF